MTTSPISSPVPPESDSKPEDASDVPGDVSNDVPGDVPKRSASDRVVDLRALSGDPSDPPLSDVDGESSEGAEVPVEKNESVSAPEPPVGVPTEPSVESVANIPGPPRSKKPRKSMPKKKKKAKVNDPRAARRKKIILIGSIAFFVGLVGAIVIALLFRNASFLGDSVVFTLEAPREMRTGEEGEVIVRVRNSEEVPLDDVLIDVAYPAEFEVIEVSPRATSDDNTSWSLGTLAVGHEMEVRIRGRFVGTPGSGLQINSAVHYSPENVSSSFSEEASTVVALIPADFGIVTTVPASVVAGGEMTYALQVTNQEPYALSDVVVQVDAPADFQVSSSKPPLEDGISWTIDSMTPGSTESFEVRGVLSGDVDAEGLFKASAGFIDTTGEFASQESREDSVKIVEVGAKMEISMNGSSESVPVRPGDAVSFELLYENTGSEPIYNATVDIPFGGSLAAISEASIEADRGEVVNGTRVRFTSETLTDLERIDPNKGGKLVFSAEVPENVKTKQGEKDLELTLTPTLTAKTDPVNGEEVNIEGTALAFKVGTKVTQEIALIYYDDEGRQIGTGPLPPEVGEKTTFIVEAFLSNTTSAVQSTVATFTLEDGARVIDLADPTAGSIELKGSKVIWDIGLMPEEVGTTLPQFGAAFTVQVTPSRKKIGQTIPILSGTTLIGHDKYSGLDVSLEDEALDTSLEHDSFGKGKGKVIEGDDS